MVGDLGRQSDTPWWKILGHIGPFLVLAVPIGVSILQVVALP